MHKINVYLITPKNNPRNVHLVNQFNSSDEFNLIIVPAIMTSNFEEVKSAGLSFDGRAFLKFSGRNLLASEIGCAASHNVARGMIAQSGTEGIVIEDDAELLNLEKLHALILRFRSFTDSEAFVLSLTDFQTSGRKYRNEMSAIDKVSFIKLLGHPPLAVATYMNAMAADRMFSKNTPITWVSDWPPTNCDFFVATSAFFRHSVDPKSSLIDPGNFLERNIKKKVGIRISWMFGVLFNFVKGPYRFRFLERFITYKILHRIDMARVASFVNSVDS